MSTEKRNPSCEKRNGDAPDAETVANLRLRLMIDCLLKQHSALAGAVADARTARGNLNELQMRLLAEHERVGQLKEKLKRTEQAIIRDQASVEGLSLMKLRHSQNVERMRAAFGDAVKLLLDAPIPDHTKNNIRLELASLQQREEAAYPAAIQRIMTIISWLLEQCEMRMAPRDPFVIPEEPRDTTTEIEIPPPPPKPPTKTAQEKPPPKMVQPQNAPSSPAKPAAAAPEKRERERVHIRWMIRRDLPEVLQIEAGSFELPWTQEDFLKCLRQRTCIGMVAEHGEKVLGFMIYELHKSKLHILNFAVHPTNRGREIGRQMVGTLIGKLSNHRRTRITLEVRETNTGGQLFFHKQGFLATKVPPNHYEDSREDAFLMEYRMPGAEDELDEDGFQSVNRIAYLDEQPEPPPPREDTKPSDGDDDDPRAPVRK